MVRRNSETLFYRCPSCEGRFSGAIFAHRPVVPCPHCQNLVKLPSQTASKSSSEQSNGVSSPPSREQSKPLVAAGRISMDPRDEESETPPNSEHTRNVVERLMAAFKGLPNADKVQLLGSAKTDTATVEKPAIKKPYRLKRSGSLPAQKAETMALFETSAGRDWPTTACSRSASMRREIWSVRGLSSDCYSSEAYSCIP